MTVLCGILAVLLVVVFCCWGSLHRVYQTAAVQSAIRRGDFAAALRLLNGFPVAQHTAEWHFLRARAERRSGHASEAEAELARAAELGWNEQQIARQRLLLKGQMNIREVEREMAQACSAGGSDEEAEEAYEAMARGYLSALRFNESAACLSFWSDWQPSNPIPHLWMGELHDRAESAEMAAQEFEAALKCDPTHFESRLKLAKIRLDQQQMKPAAELFAQCLAQSSDSMDVLMGLANCKRREGAEAEAKSLLHDTLLLDLEAYQQALVLGALAKSAQEEGRDAQALQLFSQSIALNPNDFSNRLAFASALLQAGQTGEAEVERKIGKEMAVRHGRFVQVRRQISQWPQDADLRCEAGRILLEQGIAGAGVMWLETALTIDPQHRAAHQALANYYRQAGQIEQAEKHEASAAVSKPGTSSEQSGAG